MNQDNAPSAVHESLFKNKIDLRQVAEDLGYTILSSQGRQEIRFSADGTKKDISSLCIYPEMGFFACHRLKAGGDVIRFVEFTQSWDRKKAAGYLAETYLPSGQDALAAAPPPPSHPDAYYLDAALYESVFSHGKEMLFQPEGSHSRSHLTAELGYEGGRLINSQWIHWPQQREITDRLARQFPEAQEQISQLALTGSHGDGFRLAFPYRDGFGAITGYIKQATPPPRTGLQQRLDADQGPVVPRDETPGIDRTDLFNLWRVKDEKTIVVVEEAADALFLHFNKIPGVVAMAGEALTSERLKSLEQIRAGGLVLAPGTPASKGKLTEEATQTILFVLGQLKDSGIEVRVVSPEKWAPHATGAQYLRKQGAKAASGVLETAETGNVWFVRHIFANYQASLGYQKSQALEKFIEIYSQNAKNEEKAALKQTAAECTGLSVAQIEEKIYAYFEELARAEEDPEEQAPQEAPVKEFTVADLELEAGVTDLRMTRRPAVISPYLAETLDSDVRRLSEGLTTGFEGVDSRLRIPNGAVTLVCSARGPGRPRFCSTS